MNLCLRTRPLKFNIIGTLYRSSTTKASEDVQNEQVLIDDADDVQAREAEIEKKRNISRLSPAHFNLMNGRRPYETAMCLAHRTVKYNRKLYGKYGSASGVNPNLCWPTQNDIEDRKEYESVAFPYTIKEMMESAAQKRKEERLKIEVREKEVAIKFAKLEQWKKELNDKVAKKIADAQVAKEKKRTSS